MDLTIISGESIRMNRKDEKKMVPTEMTFNSVTFENFPSYVDSQGEVSYPLMSSVVAERFAKQIPDDIKAVIKVDFAKLDFQKLFSETKDAVGIQPQFSSEEEARDAEEKLLSELVDMGLFSNEN